jgi:integrase
VFHSVETEIESNEVGMTATRNMGFIHDPRLARLHRVLALAERRGLVDRNVARVVDPPRPGPSPARALTPDEAAALLSVAEGSRWEPFFLLALLTGARRGELHGLVWEAVDFERSTMTIRQSLGGDRKGGFFVKCTKTGRERVVALTASAIDALRRLRAIQAAEKLAAGSAYQGRGFVFADPFGAPVNPDETSKAFALIAKRAGIEHVNLHLLRHSAATWALANGSDVRTVATMLGHSAPATTLNIYGHVVAGLQTRASDGLAETLQLAQARRAGGRNEGL